MNLGFPELIVTLLVAIAFVLPIYGIVKAIMAKDWGWVVGIVISTAIGIGGVATLIYLWTNRSQASR